MKQLVINKSAELNPPTDFYNFKLDYLLPPPVDPPDGLEPPPPELPLPPEPLDGEEEGEETPEFLDGEETFPPEFLEGDSEPEL